MLRANKQCKAASSTVAMVLKWCIDAELLLLLVL
jgi:hypothetical protein